MQLSSRILTALAVLILAVGVLSVRAGDSSTLDAATGTIDVVNVGTCYTTNDDVFGVGDCNDGVGGDFDLVTNDNDDGEISEVGTVYATYSFDPKTAADSPRGILKNADLIKISISDSGRDKRTPVVLAVGNAETELSADQYAVIAEDFKNIAIAAQAADGTVTAADRANLTADTVVEFTDANDVKTYHLAADMHWGAPDGTYASTRVAFTFTAGEVVAGLKILKDAAIEYLPMHAGDGAVFKFYGQIGSGGFQDLGSAVQPDEDRGSGRNTEDGDPVAPWLDVQRHDPTAVVQYIVYHTSEREVLVGGNKASDYSATEDAPAYTDDEEDAALKVRAKADGNVSTQNLWLMETGRFTGRYEGYLRLTDPDGDGLDGEGQGNWGLELQNATGSGMGSAETAVLGVESGPVVIEYGDTDGKSRALSISIDTVTPAVQIDVPAHDSRGRDTTPSFAGSYTDGESGLREDSFRLYVDNSNDETNTNLALDLTVDAATDLSGYVADSPTPIRSVDQYIGYAADEDADTDDGPDQFGVIDHTKIYALEDDDLLHVEGDRHDDGSGTGTFSNSVRIRLRDGDDEIDEYNNTIDFHALVVDVAGNVGFSDSDDEGPRFINDYGDTGSDRKTGMYNVLGWYARHVFHLDEKEPVITAAQSVTGFYGVNEDKKPVTNRSGILISFDGAIDADTVGVDTFEVTLDAETGQSSGAQAEVVDTTVNGASVYLLLGEELASDATPSLKLGSGQSISDPAGNSLSSGGDLTGENETSIELNDGIAPQLTVTLSGGSGSGEGNEGPDKLTNEAMTISIASDETIQTTPSITAVCSNIAWTVTDDDGDSETKELSNFTGARGGSLATSTATFDQPKFRCGDGETTDETIQAQQVRSFSRPGLVWEFEWQNFEDDKELPDGKVTVVAYGRDRTSYKNLDDATTYNWGITTAEFTLDTEKPALSASSTPGEDETVTETRPFVLLNFDDASSVSVDSFEFDGTEQEVTVLGTKRFLYWPEEMSIGGHSYVVEAVDAAGNNSGAIERPFKVAARKGFDLKLIAGWNAVSVPANPVDPSIDAVFTEDVVDMVAAWDGSDPEKPWSIATRMDGEWSTDDEFATLTKITARYGYWVHAQGFVTQRVALIGKSNRESADLVPPDLVEIPTLPGWNFVGVIDQEGDQTQENFGDVLEAGEETVNADSYLGKNAVKSYTWDAVRSQFNVLEGGDDVKIGQGIWVYFGGGIAP